MGTIEILLLLFAVALIFVTILAVAIGYFWASSATKSALLKQIKDQGNAAFKQAQEQLQTWKEQELNAIRQQMLEGVRGEAIKEAQDQLLKWRTADLENAKKQIWEVLSKEAAVSFEQWKADAEKGIRQDAIDKSQSVTMGKMTEHLVPYLPGFGFNPADARFIGSPVDLVVFDGLGNDEVKRIVFVEIKTGTSTLSTRERFVRDAILEKRVEWIEMKANLEGPDIVLKSKSRRKAVDEEAGWMLKLLKNNEK
jgi:predicted Holliday junction resolvase-like endonuclease